MVRSVRGRKISPLELLDAHLTQIRKEQPRINAFVDVYEESARLAAKQATESLLLDGEFPPLHGIPVTIKDSFDILGHPTLCGSRFRLEHVADQDSTAVARLR